MFDTEKLKRIFGANVKFYREKEKWTQENLAEKCDVALNTIKHIEAGISWPECETFVKLINIFGLDSCDLLISGESSVMSKEKVFYLMENVKKTSDDYIENMTSIIDREFSFNHIEKKDR